MDFISFNASVKLIAAEVIRSICSFLASCTFLGLEQPVVSAKIVKNSTIIINLLRIEISLIIEQYGLYLYIYRDGPLYTIILEHRKKAIANAGAGFVGLQLVVLKNRYADQVPDR